MEETDFDKVRRYYGQGKEWERLETAAGKLEYLRTLKLMDEYLPGRSRVLDLGGGPGRYTVALAQRGHRVSLADLSPELLEIAGERIAACGIEAQVESVEVVNAVDLSRYQGASFDAVLASGPFYHLHQEVERVKCAHEICRVLRQRGFLFAAFIPRLSMLADLIRRAAQSFGQVSVKSMEEVFQKGIFRNQALEGFQEAFTPDSQEMVRLFEDAGFRMLAMHSLKGIARGNEEALFEIEKEDPELFGVFLEMLEKTSRDGAVIELGEHALYIGQKS